MAYFKIEKNKKGLVAKIQSLESEIVELEGRRTDLERSRRSTW